LGEVPLAGPLRDALLTEIDPLVIDDQAHSFEHSLEVMLPFLQKRRDELEIVPISLGRLNLAECLMLGHGLAQVVSGWSEDVLLLASSDMNHFDSAATTEKLDAMAIEAMAALDPERLYRVVREHQISMCGVLPVVAVLQAARLLGAQECRLLQHAHSGRINGDDSSVVGYAGLTVA
jgi:AmmeMemoRadiSam system protein B